MAADKQWPAGKYELTATSWDEDKREKPTDPFDYVRHVTGDIVTLNAAEAERLGRGGAIVKPGEREQLAYEAAAAAAQQAQAAAEAAQAKMLAAAEPAEAPKEKDRPTPRAVTGPSSGVK